MKATGQGGQSERKIMAKGITQEQVNGAIDQLVAGGERPTIERIRAVLGTGSPNTVNRMLDTWWAGLSRRLAEHQAKVLLPDAPAAVSKAATDLWVAALEQARAEADRETDSLVVDFTRMRESLAARRAEVDTLLDAHIASATASQQAQQLAEARLEELHRLLEQQSRHVADLQSRHDQAIEAQTALTAKLDAAHASLAGVQDKAANERTALETAHRAAEDRWLREVDRARLDAAAAAADMAQLQRASSTAAQQAQERTAELTARLRQAEREDAAKTARLTTLEGQLNRLHEQLKQWLGRPVAMRQPATKKVMKARSKSSRKTADT
jgi:chromosome segregation ATPase